MQGRGWQNYLGAARSGVWVRQQLAGAELAEAHGRSAGWGGCVGEKSPEGRWLFISPYRVVSDRIIYI